MAGFAEVMVLLFVASVVVGVGKIRQIHIDFKKDTDSDTDKSDKSDKSDK